MKTSSTHQSQAHQSKAHQSKASVRGRRPGESCPNWACRRENPAEDRRRACTRRHAPGEPTRPPIPHTLPGPPPFHTGSCLGPALVSSGWSRAPAGGFTVPCERGGTRVPADRARGACAEPSQGRHPSGRESRRREGAKWVWGLAPSGDRGWWAGGLVPRCGPDRDPDGDLIGPVHDSCRVNQSRVSP